LENIGKGARNGALIGGTFSAGVGTIPLIKNPIQKSINNAKPLTTKTLSGLTAVPEDIVNYALEKELANQSIFNNIPKNIPLEYNKLANKALQGIKKAEIDSNKKIVDSFADFGNDKIDISDLKDEINGLINDSYQGEDVSLALGQTGVRPIIDELTNFIGLNSDKKVSPMLLHRLKRESFDKKLAREYGQYSGEGADLLKGIRHSIDNFLDTKFPKYNEANVNRATIHNIVDDASKSGGLNPQTLAGKLENFEQPSAFKRGFNEDIQMIDDMVPDNYKFLDDVRTLNAQKQLNSWTPGQGGGSGSGQGFANLLRTGILEGLGGRGVPILNATLGTTLFSPKLMGQGTIKTLGKLYRGADNLYNFEPETVSKYVTPLSVRLLGYDE
jgi:hypothetical protein